MKRLFTIFLLFISFSAFGQGISPVTLQVKGGNSVNILQYTWSGKTAFDSLPNLKYLRLNFGRPFKFDPNFRLSGDSVHLANTIFIPNKVVIGKYTDVLDHHLSVLRKVSTDSMESRFGASIFGGAFMTSVKDRDTAHAVGIRVLNSNLYPEWFNDGGGTGHALAIIDTCNGCTFDPALHKLTITGGGGGSHSDNGITGDGSSGSPFELGVNPIIKDVDIENPIYDFFLGDGVGHRAFIDIDNTGTGSTTGIFDIYSGNPTTGQGHLRVFSTSTYGTSLLGVKDGSGNLQQITFSTNSADAANGIEVDDDVYNRGLRGGKKFNVVDGFQYIQKITADSIAKAKGDSIVSAHPSGTLTNPITFNNGGFGASSGATADGSSPVTISYNTLGAVPTSRTVAGHALTSNVVLSSLSATNSSLTFTGAYIGNVNQTVGINWAFSNPWSIAQQFHGGIGLNHRTATTTDAIQGTDYYLNYTGTFTATLPDNSLLVPDQTMIITSNTGTITLAAFSGTTINGTTSISVTSGVTTTVYYDQPNTNWVIAQTGSLSGSGSGITSVSGTTNRITSTGSTTPVIDISSSYVGQSSITTVGTLSSGSIPYSLLTGTPSALPPNGSAGGELSGTYPNPTLVNSAVIGKVLTGYTSGAGTISSSDNILQAIQKLNGNDALKVLTSTTVAGFALSSNVTLATLTPGSTLTNSSGASTYNGSAASTFDINLAHSNTWTALQTINIAGITTNNTDGFFVQNPTASTNSVTVQNAPIFHIRGHSWHTTSLVDYNNDWAINPLSASSNSPASTFRISSYSGSSSTPTWTTRLSIDGNTGGVLAGASLQSSTSVIAPYVYGSGSAGTGGVYVNGSDYGAFQNYASGNRWGMGYSSSQTSSGIMMFGWNEANTFIGKGALIHNETLNAINSTATATVAQMVGGYITSTSAAATTITTPTAAALITQINTINQNSAGRGTWFEFTIDNTAGANTVTLALDTSITQLTGVSSSLTVPSGTTGIGTWRITFTSTTTANIARIQ